MFDYTNQYRKEVSDPILFFVRSEKGHQPLLPLRNGTVK
jgi:hypothetical protein